MAKKKSSKGLCLYWNWKGCKIKKTPKIKRRSRMIFKRKKGQRKGLNKWVKGAIGAVVPSAAAIGVGLIKTLLKKNTGYSDIYA